jgi:hypothetical protein
MTSFLPFYVFIHLVVYANQSPPRQTLSADHLASHIVISGCAAPMTKPIGFIRRFMNHHITTASIATNCDVLAHGMGLRKNAPLGSFLPLVSGATPGAFAIGFRIILPPILTLLLVWCQVLPPLFVAAPHTDSLFFHKMHDDTASRIVHKSGDFGPCIERQWPTNS